MRIFGTFKNNNNDTVKVYIYNKVVNASDINIDISDDVRFADEPVTIKSDCENMLTHLIKTQCEINLLSKIWLGDYLFANKLKDIVVNVYVEDTCVFAGYVTPNTYNQDYADMWETITVNCIDKISSLEYEYLTDDVDYDTLKSNADVKSFIDYVDDMKINDSGLYLGAFPSVINNNTWIPTDYVEIDGNYYELETNVNVLDANTGVATGNTQVGSQITPTWETSTDTMVVDGVVYYVEYEVITVNGVTTRTGNTRPGQPAGQPTEDTSIPRVFHPTGVMQVNPGLYYEYGYYTATMTDGSTCVMTDGVGQQLQYDYVYGSPRDVDDNGHRLKFAHVNYDGQDYYYKNDLDYGVDVGTYDIEGRVNTNTQFSIGGHNAVIDATPDIDGNYFFYVDGVAGELYDRLFRNLALITAVEYMYDVTDHTFDMIRTYEGCENLIVGYIPNNIGTASYTFDGCTKMQFLIVNDVPSASQLMMATVPVSCYLYAPDAQLQEEWAQEQPHYPVTTIDEFYNFD